MESSHKMSTEKHQLRESAYISTGHIERPGEASLDIFCWNLTVPRMLMNCLFIPL